MADANLKASPSVTERFVTVQQIQRDSRSKKPHWQRKEPPIYPWLKLAGRWIEQAGFSPGQRVKINVGHGRLVITAE
ncbi:SymE family type I addiction module toxin [Caballeronia sp. LZ032]|uniref:SymE family type I addiction module toxin n=1 Tax=Caballeronia sp. LZ032 TaxID=3038565 RepID=UPI0028671E28|nr:SymE family type I addiction module toxin [Caballeronia sp. LZ032]MDR5881007.1 SymE family type I addiction module toxin [Caballeronia sp. LZ032]